MDKTEIIKEIVKSMQKFGITNPFMQAAILAIVSKESAFILGSGENMNYTSPERLRFVFQTAFKNKDDAYVNQYVRNPVGLANLVYGGKYGNTAPNDGWTYRGRGWNGITFKGAYERYGKLIGADLIKNPDLLNQVPYASDALAAYFVDTFKNSGGELAKLGAKDINDFKDLQSAVHAAMRANAGWKSSTQGNIFKEGEKKAMEAAPGFYNMVRELVGIAIAPAATGGKILIRAWKDKKKRPWIILGGLATATAIGIGINKLTR